MEWKCGGVLVVEVEGLGVSVVVVGLVVFVGGGMWVVLLYACKCGYDASTQVLQNVIIAHILNMKMLIQWYTFTNIL